MMRVMCSISRRRRRWLLNRRHWPIDVQSQYFRCVGTRKDFMRRDWLVARWDRIFFFGINN